MGWKTFKKGFDISHIVQVRDGCLLIGSPYISALAVISMDTGIIKDPDYYHARFLSEYYPNVSAATQIEIKTLLDAEDTFTKSIPVYTCEGLRILTKYCEEVGYPNVTHDGVLMYSNTFSTDIDEVLKMAKGDREFRLIDLRERIRDRAKDLQEVQDKLALLEKEEIVYE